MEFEFRVALMEELMKILAPQKMLGELSTCLRCANNFVNPTRDFQYLPLEMQDVVHSYVAQAIEMGYVSRVFEMSLQELWL